MTMTCSYDGAYYYYYSVVVFVGLCTSLELRLHIPPRNLILMSSCYIHQNSISDVNYYIDVLRRMFQLILIHNWPHSWMIDIEPVAVTSSNDHFVHDSM